MSFAVFKLPTLKVSLIFSFFLPVLAYFSLLSFTSYFLPLVKKYIISLAVTWVHGFFYKQLKLLRVEVPKWPKTKQLLSTKYCSGSNCP